LILIIDQRVVLQQAERLHDFIKRAPDVMEPSKPIRLPRIRGDIHFQRVSFGYDQSSSILNEFELHIQAGEKVALVGGSGNGKSTILKLVGRFYDPVEGNISLDGVSLRELSFEQLRGAIGMVFQETYLYGVSIIENIRFGNPEATDEQVIEAAKAAYAHEFIESLPEGYNTILGERGARLSGGQKQRIAIARMFVKNPTIVLLDEATSALDNASELEVQKALGALLDGRTTITVAHRLSTVKHYDRIVLIEEGKNFEEGTYDELMSRQGRFYLLVEGEIATEKAGEQE
jgi:ATP-binding cassette subfamily B protein/subfamily B ATP-binding cassette protein MsbA